VAALAHVLADHQHVWVDIFAVRQGPGNGADIDFAPVVREAKGLVLVARHVQEVEDMGEDDLVDRRVPKEAFRTCAFFRLWCVVELAAALRHRKPVVMLVGAAAEEGDGFIPNQMMLKKLFHLLAVEKSHASVEADAVREMGRIKDEFGGVDAVNSLARGAVTGAQECMDQPAVLSAALGNTAALDALETREAHEEAMRAAAAGGFVAVVYRLLERSADPSAADGFGKTALMRAARGGHLLVVERLGAALGDG
jgi:hypothetical protein